MRIIQLIDSLEAGGAERMAVTYANALSNTIEYSGLISSRKEGALKKQLNKNVNYLFLEKKNNSDYKAFLKFRKFIILNEITIIHAHSSSYFWATLLKISYPKIKVIWHDHFGNRIYQKSKSNFILKLCSNYFSGIITVNEELKKWSKSNLKCSKVIYLANFIPEIEANIENKTVLNGLDGKRIVFLANLKKPKNHLNILKAFYEAQKEHPDWSIHLIGKDYEDSYSYELKNYIDAFNLKDSIFIYNSCSDISNILKQATIGVLGSTYEGFPVTLLEYGNASLIVMTTNVGYCSSIIKHNENGFLFNPLKQEEVISTFVNLFKSIKKRDQNIEILGNRLFNYINCKYSQKIILKQYLNFIN